MLVRRSASRNVSRSAVLAAVEQRDLQAADKTAQELQLVRYDAGIIFFPSNLEEL